MSACWLQSFSFRKENNCITGTVLVEAERLGEDGKIVSAKVLDEFLGTTLVAPMTDGT